MIVAMMNSKMIAKWVSSGETPKTWKCRPIKAIGNEVRKTRSPWNASKKTRASSLAHTQTRNPSGLTLLFLPNIRKSKTRKIHLTSKKKKRFSFFRFISQTYHNECNSLRRDEQAINNIISFTLTTYLIHLIKNFKNSIFMCICLCTGEFVIIEVIQ